MAKFITLVIVGWALTLSALLLIRKQLVFSLVSLALTITVLRSTIRGKSSRVPPAVGGRAGKVDADRKPLPVESPFAGSLGDDGVERLLMPLCLLSERCNMTSLVSGYDPLLCYGAALASYLSLFPLAAAIAGTNKKATEGGAAKKVPLTSRQVCSIPLEVWGYLLASPFVMFFLTRSVLMSVALAAYPTLALLIEVALTKWIPSGEAHLVGQFAGYVAAVQLTQTQLLSTRGDVTVATTHEHFAGHAAMVTALGTACTMHLLLTYVPSKVRSFLFGTASKSEPPATGKVTAIFLVVLGIFLTGAYELCAYEFKNISPAEWAMTYIFFDKSHRNILMGWFATLVVGLLIISKVEPMMPLVVRRKSFHFLAVALFAPVLMINQGPYLSLGIAAAFAISVIVETGRLSGVVGAKTATALLKDFIDERDGAIIRTHLYLMGGCGVALWFRHRVVYIESLDSFAGSAHAMRNLAISCIPGIIQLGVGDAVAAVIGTWIGKTKWAALLCGKMFPGRDNAPLVHKSVQGTIAAIVSCYAAWAVIGFSALRVFPSDSNASMLATLNLLMNPVVHAGILGGVLCEAVALGTDNLSVPLFTYGLMHTVAALRPV